jgi:hypothetical protein
VCAFTQEILPPPAMQLFLPVRRNVKRFDDKPRTFAHQPREDAPQTAVRVNVELFNLPIAVS